ncbi:MAG: GNAT family N-acetyltransferase [Solobacterium sp.]|nr:GNAT family N-acetyltransferase [Solobacterium sp.]
MLEVRKTTIEDLEKIMPIVEEARAYFKAHGIDQWQNGYPNYEGFLEDIKNNGSYVLVEDKDVVGFCYIGLHDDPNYSLIEEGDWLNEEAYGVIHRIAIKNAKKGNNYASLLLQYAEKLAKEKGISNLRIDTHEKNTSMQALVKKNGYIYCGRVYMEDHSPRIAFQKILED